MAPLDPRHFLNESILTLPQLAARIPGSRRNGRINTSTLTRWIQRGARRWDGVLVRLEAAKSGSAWLTSWEAYTRFVDALTPPDPLSPSSSNSTPPSPTDCPRTPHVRQKASEDAAAELDRRGA